jgi:leucyl aminopeptidase (aminopeptidase T)
MTSESGQPIGVLDTTDARDLRPGARNAVRVCLDIQPHERVTVITDRVSAHIAEALVREIDAVGAERSVLVLEDLSERPLRALPDAVAADLAQSGVSIFAARAQANELGSRIQMTDIVNRRRMRHAHMVNITDQIMCEGMRADFHAVDRLSAAVIEIARRARTIRATSPAGTDVTAAFSPSLRWIKTSGLITPEKWGNLPGGEIFTSPADVNGVFVIDGVVGDWLCDRYGLLTDHPLTVHIAGSRITSVESANAALSDDFWRYTHTDENSDRVGEFAIGTNIGLSAVIGQILQDEKFPGLHIAFGNPYGAHTGATWWSSTHIDVVGTRFDIWADDRQIMRAGRFLVGDAPPPG